MEWISIETELPEEAERVLLYTPFDVFGDDHACVGNREALLGCTIRQAGRSVPLFTHWLPLPAAPLAGISSAPLAHFDRQAV